MAAHDATVDNLAEIQTSTATHPISTTTLATTIFDILHYFGPNTFTQQELAEAPPLYEERRSPSWHTTTYAVSKLHAAGYLAITVPRKGPRGSGRYKANPGLGVIAQDYNDLYAGTIDAYQLDFNSRAARGMVALALDLPKIDSLENMSELTKIDLAVVRNLYFALGVGALRCLGRIDASINRMVHYRLQQKKGLIPD